jgi:hypothetical protein
MVELAVKVQSDGLLGLRASLLWIFFYVVTHVKDF